MRTIKSFGHKAEYKIKNVITLSMTSNNSIYIPKFISLKQPPSIHPEKIPPRQQNSGHNSTGLSMSRIIVLAIYCWISTSLLVVQAIQMAHHIPRLSHVHLHRSFILPTLFMPYHRWLPLFDLTNDMIWPFLLVASPFFSLLRSKYTIRVVSQF